MTVGFTQFGIGRRALRVLAALLVGGLALLSWAPAADADPGIEAAFVSKINQLRASKGLGSLRVDGELTGIARRWAGQMAAAGNISHNGGFSAQVTSDWAKLGENVGMGPEVGSLFQAFVNSPSHYRNLVDPAFTHVGVGVVVSDGIIFTAHQFMALRTPAPAPAPAPAAVPPPPPAPATTVAPAPAPVPTAAPVRAAQAQPAPVKPQPLQAAPATKPAPSAAAKPPVAAIPVPPVAPAAPDAGSATPSPTAAPVAVELVQVLEGLRALDQ